MEDIMANIRAWIDNGFKVPSASQRDVERARRHIRNLDAASFKEWYGYIKLMAWINPDFIDRGVSAREMLALFQADAKRRGYV